MSTVSLKRELAVLGFTRSAVIGTVNGTGIDADEHGRLLFEVYIDASINTATIDVKIQESPDNSTWTDLSGAAITQIVDSGGDAAGKFAYIDVKSDNLTVNASDRKPMRYVRSVITNGTANATVIVKEQRYRGRYNDALDVDFAGVVELVEV